MTEPKIKEIHVWIASEIRDAQKQLLTSNEKYIHRNFIRMMKAIHSLISHSGEPRAVTAKQVEDLFDEISGTDSVYGFHCIVEFLVDLGVRIEEEK